MEESEVGATCTADHIVVSIIMILLLVTPKSEKVMP